jgi:hypothetical protein
MSLIDKSLGARLNRLFSNNVIVRRVGGKKLRVLDTDRLQSAGNLEQSKYVDRFTRLHGIKPSISTYNNNYNYQSSRTELYTDYEIMDMDSIIAAALDIYSDEATRKNEYDEILTIKSADETIKKVLENLFYDILNVDFNLWPWIRSMCKYGDFYLYLDIREDIGIINVTPLSAYEVIREEGTDPNNPYHVQFSIMGNNKNKYKNYEIAHFRLLTDSNFLPYGKSMLEPARKVWKQLTMMEDAMLIHRVMRAPERRIFKIDVGNIPPNEVDNYMQQIMNKMKKQPYIDQQTGDYDLKFNLMNMLEDFYLPVRGGASGTEIDTLSGMEFTGIEDIEYLKNRMLAGLKIPKAFLTFDEGIAGKALLAAEDVRFARTIERVQRIVVSELTKIAVIHLFAQGYKNEDLVNFEIGLTTPSIVYEQELIALWKEKIELAKEIQDSKLLSEDWIYKHIFKLSDNEWQDERDKVLDDMKNKFRQTQIEEEGNDPLLTGESFGTPHDIAALHVSKRNAGGDTEIENNGRPKKGGSTYGTDAHSLGRDPIGSKGFKPGVDLSVKEGLTQVNKTSSRTAAKNLGLINLKKDTSKKLILESIQPSKKQDSDAGTFLDESNISE